MTNETSLATGARELFRQLDKDVPLIYRPSYFRHGPSYETSGYLYEGQGTTTGGVSVRLHDLRHGNPLVLGIVCDFDRKGQLVGLLDNQFVTTIRSPQNTLLYKVTYEADANKPHIGNRCSIFPYNGEPTAAKEALSDEEVAKLDLRKNPTQVHWLWVFTRLATGWTLEEAGGYRLEAWQAYRGRPLDYSDINERLLLTPSKLPEESTQ